MVVPPPPGSLISDDGEVYIPAPRPPVVQCPPKKRQGKRAGDAAVKPGKVSWIWGTKLVFFEARKADWLAASETNQTGKFYTKMAKLYTAKYGFHLADNEDFEFDVVDPPDWAANKVVNERLTPEETEFRQNFWNKCRDVSEMA
jgi:hypothetical protein